MKYWLNRSPVGFFLVLFIVGIVAANVVVAITTPPATAPVSGDYVERVIDGDTFDLVSGERIRLFAINAPEAATEDYGYATRIALRQMVRGTEVQLLRKGLDKYGRTLACVYTQEGISVDNYLLSLPGVRKWRGVSCPLSQ
ncbi:hypothetical protein LCGC14_2241180 [marine sediment metagenome]|uniref:TNase-like domain-containing protein n=1 Tax=marine sediment metagenome TaxID=412755 RepID=A0A0F9FI00_9ZZZZ